MTAVFRRSQSAATANQSSCDTNPLVASQQNPRQRNRDHSPRYVIRADDHGIPHALPSDAHHHGLGRQIEPGKGMEENKEEGDDVENDEQRTREARQEPRVGLRPSLYRVRLRKREERKIRHRKAGQLAQHEFGVRPAFKPPPHRNRAAIPLGMVKGVVRSRIHYHSHFGFSILDFGLGNSKLETGKPRLVLRSQPPSRVGVGNPKSKIQNPKFQSSDLNQWTTPESLYCWMAPAGSTSFGQALVHSPTNVHCHMPSCSEIMPIRSADPSSRESLL